MSTCSAMGLATAAAMPVSAAESVLAAAAPERNIAARKHSISCNYVALTKAQALLRSAYLRVLMMPERDRNRENCSAFIQATESFIPRYCAFDRETRQFCDDYPTEHGFLKGLNSDASVVQVLRDDETSIAQLKAQVKGTLHEATITKTVAQSFPEFQAACCALFAAVVKSSVIPK